jgi:hypothetical protein
VRMVRVIVVVPASTRFTIRVEWSYLGPGLGGPRHLHVIALGPCGGRKKNTLDENHTSANRFRQIYT